MWDHWIHIFWCLLVNAQLVVLLENSSVDSQTHEPDPQVLEQHAMNWKNDQKRFLVGLREAVAFRRQLLAGDAGAIGELFADYQQINVPFPERPQLQAFCVTSEAFVRQLAGEESLQASNCLAPFAGCWFGIWDKLRVDHHWSEPTEVELPRSVAKELSVQCSAMVQYAWVGNGFGWNYLVQPEGAKGHVLLGFVYYVNSQEPWEIVGEAPYVGHVAGKGRVIWLTPSAFYFEEIFCMFSSKSTYAITGSHYSCHAGEAILQGRSYQAIYTKSSIRRPKWVNFSAKLPSLIDQQQSSVNQHRE